MMMIQLFVPSKIITFNNPNSSTSMENFKVFVDDFPFLGDTFRSPQLVFRCVSDLWHLSGPQKPIPKAIVMLNPLIFLVIFLPTVRETPLFPVPPLLNHHHLTRFWQQILPHTSGVNSGHCKSSCTHSACPCLAHKCNGVLPSTSLCFNKLAFCLRKHGDEKVTVVGWIFRLAGSDVLNFWEITKLT